MFGDDTAYTFSTMTIPEAVGIPRLDDINDRGDIVGSYFDGGPHEHGFIDRHGRITSFDVPGAALTEPSSINNRGDVVGTYLVEQDGGSALHGFRYHHGRFETIDLPGAADTQLFGINDRGAMVGFGTGGSVGSEGFLLEHGRFTAIAVPEDGSDFTTIPRGINDRGQIVGDHGLQGFLYDHGSYTPIAPPGAVFFADLYDINNHGQIVGDAATARGVVEGFIYRDGHFTMLDFPVPNGPPETFPRGLNDAGEIVGNSDTVLALAAFLATPVRHGHGERD